jgi:WD40 repeat protein
VAVSSTGLVVSASYDHTLRVWDLESGKHIHTLSGHTSSVSAVSITADGRHAVSASHDHTLRVWDLETGGHLYTLAGHARSVNAMAIIGTQGHLVSASNDNTVRLWTMEGTNVASFSADGPVICVAVTRDGAIMAAGDYLGRTHVLRLCQPARR